MRRTPLIGAPEYLEARGRAKVLDRLRNAWRRAWTPRVAPDPVEWVEGGGVVMPSSVAARGNGGRLSFRARPYWRSVLSWLSLDGVETIIVVVASQCGKTTLDIAIALYSAEWRRGNTLFLMPSEEHAEDLVRDRLRPIFQASPFARGLKAQALRLGGVTFPGGGSLNVIGVGSPNALKGRPAGTVVFDEYDEAGRYNKAAGSPLARAITRMRTYGPYGRCVATSTPTIEDEGIWPELEVSRRHEWHAMCPDCGTFQALDMGRIWWPRNADGDHSESPSRIAADDLARYECCSCGSHWTDAQKRQAVSDGHMVCINPEAPLSKIGVQISVLYSPDVTLSKIAATFLECLSDGDKLTQFRNEWLAEPIRKVVRTNSTEQAHLATLGFDGYNQPAPDWWKSDAIPQAPDFVRGITWGFDVQGSEVWGLCRGWGDYGESIVLWCGKFPGPEDIEDACVAFRREWIIQGGEVVRPKHGMMDSGHRTHEVYRACSKTHRLMPCKGRQDGTLPMNISQVDRLDANRRTAGRIDLAILWTTYWQDQVDAALCSGPGRGRGVCHLPSNPPHYLYRHLGSERRILVKGKPVWKTQHGDNHLRDCLVYSTAAAGYSRLLEMRPLRPVPAEAIDLPAGMEVRTSAPVAPSQAPTPAKKESAMARMLRLRGAGSGAIQMRKL